MAYCKLGHASFARNRLDEAIVLYRKALAVKPDCVEAHGDLGTIWACQGQLDEAIAEYRKALSIQRDYADGQKNLDKILRIPPTGWTSSWHVVKRCSEPSPMTLPTGMI